MGVEEVQVEECQMGVEDASLSLLGSPEDVYGFIFLFRYRRKDYASDSRLPQQASMDSKLWFAKQMINDACATQALLGILLNSEEVTLGDMLRNFKDFTTAMPPDVRGDLIGQNEAIRSAHNNFARPEPFVSDNKKKAEDGDDVFHFISYIPKNGKVVEIDGLQESAIVLGDIPDKTDSIGWMRVAQTALKERFRQCGDGETHFNLMAVVKDKGAVAKSALLKETAKSDGGNEHIMRQLRETIEAQEAQSERWKKENQRRRHNYIPFIVKLFQVLAKQNKLQKILEDTKTKRKEAKAAKSVKTNAASSE
eukprot:GSMAST32.ASY1.ANO1.1802.1 assembled CDS